VRALEREEGKEGKGEIVFSLLHQGRMIYGGGNCGYMEKKREGKCRIACPLERGGEKLKSTIQREEEEDLEREEKIALIRGRL